MNPKFTDGPWQILELEDDKEYIRIRGTRIGLRYKIADVNYPKTDIESMRVSELQESLSNANLISKAPELYSKLHEMIDQFDSVDCNEYEYKLIKSAKELIFSIDVI